MTLYIVDDSAVARERLVSAAKGIEGLKVVGTTGSALEAINQILRLRPDAAILELRVADRNGIFVLQTLKREAPGTIVILFTTLCYEHYRDPCISAGAGYFFDKSKDFEELIEVLGHLARGKEYKPRTSPRLIGTFIHPPEIGFQNRQ